MLSEVTYGINVQPVVAFVGGVQFDVMPKPLVSVDTTVGWDSDQADFSYLRFLCKILVYIGLMLYSS